MSEANERLREALKPFAAMHREGCDLDEVACERGTASDLTMLTSRDFANAAEALAAPASSPQPVAGGDVVPHLTVDELRAAGWAVAVHNDYRLHGEPHTFWLFTRGNECVKGEGRTDVEALNAIRAALAAPASAPPSMRAGEAVWTSPTGNWSDLLNPDGTLACQVARVNGDTQEQNGEKVQQWLNRHIAAALAAPPAGDADHVPDAGEMVPAGDAGGDIGKLLSAMENHASRPESEWAEASKCLRYLARDVRALVASRAGEGEK